MHLGCFEESSSCRNHTSDPYFLPQRNASHNRECDYPFDHFLFVEFFGEPPDQYNFFVEGWAMRKVFLFAAKNISSVQTKIGEVRHQVKPAGKIPMSHAITNAGGESKTGSTGRSECDTESITLVGYATQ